MSINGLKVASDQNVLTIRQLLAEVGVLVSADPNSKRNIRIRQLIEDQKKYELGDVIGILTDLPDEEAPDLNPQPEQDLAPPPRDDTVAVIIWVGTQLTTFQIERLRNVYTTLDVAVQHGRTDALARVLCERVILDDQDPVVNQQMIGFMDGAEGVYQALDQELNHAKATRRCIAQLEGIASQILVYRPADACFIRLDLQHIPNTWPSYGVNDNDQLIPPLVPGKKIILVTVGHGGPIGHTSFPGRGLKSQTEIGNLLAPVSLLATTLRVPLQCYPQKAVETWPGAGGAVSIDNEGRSDDIEMVRWIENNLDPAVRHWLSQF